MKSLLAQSEMLIADETWKPIYLSQKSLDWARFRWKVISPHSLAA